MKSASGPSKTAQIPLCKKWGLNIRIGRQIRFAKSSFGGGGGASRRRGGSRKDLFLLRHSIPFHPLRHCRKKRPQRSKATHAGLFSALLDAEAG